MLACSAYGYVNVENLRTVTQPRYESQVVSILVAAGITEDVTESQQNIPRYQFRSRIYILVKLVMISDPNVIGSDVYYSVS